MAKTQSEQPFKVAEGAPPSPPVMKVAAPRTDGWAPLETAPEDATARFLVRATVYAKDGKSRVPVAGTETLVRYRASRKRSGRHWVPALTIIDDRMGTKLGFRPTEWMVYVPKEANA